MLAGALALHEPYAVVRAMRLQFVFDPVVARASDDTGARLDQRVLYGSGFVSFLVGVGLLFGACLGLFPALAGWMLRPFARMCPAWILGMAVCVWVLTSWSRAWFLTGFPWLSPGAAYLDTPLAGFAPVLGGYGVELAALITAAVLVYVWIPTASAKRSTALGVVFLWLSGALLHGVAWTQPEVRSEAWFEKVTIR